MTPIIELEHLSFGYGGGDSLALHDICLTVEEGSITGVIGPSGSGKTTLSRVLSGAVPHHFAGRLYGSAHVDGRDTCELTLTDIARVVGCVQQDIDAQMVASTVEDELLFGLENFGVEHAEIEARLAGALEAVGASALRDREIATLSGGQKQKVAIAAMLALTPRVLVLDEPTAALDPVSARTVFEVLRRVNREHGVTVVVIEQMVARLAEFCDRIIVMDAGSIALAGTPREVFAHADELRRIGVDTPRTVRVSNSLAEGGLLAPGDVALTVEEAEEQVLGLLGKSMPTASRAGVSSRAQTALTRTARRMICPGARSGAASAPIVSLENVSFSYGPGAASVDGLTLEVHPGEIVGVVGENGAGKTTLTKLLNGLLKPAAGTVRIAGLDTRTTPVSEIAAHAATLFQNPDRQLCKNTVLEEVMFGPQLHGMPEPEARERAQAVIDRLGLPASAAPFSLSRGQRQIVALASVIVLEPEIIILDEPTSGLDYRECMTVMELVRERARAGAAVIMVCHDMEVVSDFATSLAVMAQGRLIARGPAREIFADAPLMERARITPPQVVDLAARLTRRGLPAFESVTEVADLVRIAKELNARA